MKNLFFDEQNTTELYFLFLTLRRYQEKRVQIEIDYQLKGLSTLIEVEKQKANLARLEKMLDFFRANSTTFITELPF